MGDGDNYKQGDDKKKVVEDYSKMKSLKFAGENNVVEMYHFFDVDGNGQVDSKEWVQRLMALSDKNGDWNLEGDELLHHASNVVRFPTLAGADGQLEEAEIKA